MTRTSTRWFLVLPVAAGALVTAAVSLVPQVRFAYDNPSLRVMMDTSLGLIALLVAALMWGRFRRSGISGDLMLSFAMGLLGASSLFFAALPSVVGGEEGAALATWAPLITRVIGNVIFAAAVFERRPAREDLRDTRGAALVVVGAAATIVGVTTLVALFGDSLPTAVEQFEQGGATDPDLEGHPGVMVVQLFLVTVFVVAALGFTRRAQQEDDELMRWFAAGAILAAFARVSYFLYPTLYTDFFYTGDLLRLGFYVMLLVGVSREIQSYWRDSAGLAVAEDRRRMARDLHDGLAQELAFISSQSRFLSRRGGSEKSFAVLAEAAERALDESRRAIAALTRPSDEPLEIAVAQSAEEVAARVGVRLRLDLQPGLSLEPLAREHLLRIVRAAVTQAGREAGAEQVTITLTGDDGLCLRVTDDGTADWDKAGEKGLNLVTMREQAEVLGADLRHVPSANGGNQVVVTIR